MKILRTCDAGSTRNLRAVLVAAGHRVDKLDGRDHIVVPVIALVEGVLHASNADDPELVLAEEFAKVPAGWNGRPVVWDHPEEGGRKVSANSPGVLARMEVGRVFNARVEGNKLKMEAWLDPEKAARIPEGARLLERVTKGLPIEVSVGTFVDAEGKVGTYSSKPYKAVWRNIVPDHLAMLPEGTRGACSIAMGCGAPRGASEDPELRDLLTAAADQPRVPAGSPSGGQFAGKQGGGAGRVKPGDRVQARGEEWSVLEVDGQPGLNVWVKSVKNPDRDALIPETELKRANSNGGRMKWWEKIKALAEGRKAPEGETAEARAARESIEESLHAEVPGFVMALEVSAEEVVYATAPGGGEPRLFKRKFKKGDKGMKFEDPEEVEEVHGYKAKGIKKDASGSCGCGGGRTASAPEDKEADMNKKDRLKALVAAGKIKETDVAALEGCSEEALKALEAQPEIKAAQLKLPEGFTSKVVDGVTVVEPKEPKAAAALETEEQALERFPRVAAIVREHQANIERRRAELTQLITASATAKDVYTADELKAMPLDQLEKVGRLAGAKAPAAAGAVDQSGRGVPRDAADDAPPKPIDMRARLLAAEEKGKKGAA